ncbi:hypothetical protein FZC79_18440 [Rossellomorea vietnamensis]|uniref:Lipoprotein n=1 Tax=Rossellomorea vietnamensis TaxID=218284 RepID=A0A5D4KBD2_9BACI|nr:hypothetical protein [Rossellomorea vietnamensis]TYR73423.1 hypothetical protein FZC79_18440 [Rossellomorea vietnamensis]
MKRVLLLFLALVIWLGGCGLKSGTFTEFYDGKIDHVNKIIILDGSTGESVAISNKDNVQGLINDIKKINFNPLEDQSERDGFRYWVSFIEEDGETFSFGDSQIGEQYYKTEPDVYPIIKKYFDQEKEG